MKNIIAALMTMVMLLAFCGAALADSVYFDGNSNVRTGPGLDYPSIGSVQEGDVLMSSGETRYDSRGVAWYEVDYGNGTGWVSSKYTSLITLNPNRYDDLDDYYTYDSPDGAIIATGDCNIRTAPDINAPSIGVLSKGGILPLAGGDVRYDSRGVAWYNVDYNGTSAWVSSTYASLY